MSDKTKLGAAHLLGSAAVSGVGALRVSDGEIFSFSAEILRELLAKAEASPEKVAVVFVRMGPELRPQ